MGAKKQVQIVFKINSLDEYEKKISEENGKVSIIDYHLGWCGPCSVIEPNFRQIFFAVDDAINRVEFLTASEEVLPEGLKDKLELDTKPTFQIWKNGVMHAQIKGVYINDIDVKVQQLLPNLDD